MPDRAEPKQPAVIFPLDWLPKWWSTREEYYALISGRLAAQGVQAVLVAARQPEPRVVERFVRAGAKVLAIPYEGRIFRYWRALRPLFREYDVRVAHIRFFDYFSLVPWICKVLGARLIVFTEANSGEARPLGPLRIVKLLRTRLALYPANVVIAISEFIRRRLIEYGARPERIVVVHNGIDIDGFRPDAAARARLEQEFSIRGDEFVVVFMSSFLPWKRPDVAIRVCAKLREQGTPVKLMMCGQGPLEADLRRLCLELNFQDAVVWAGFYPDPQHIFQGCDSFLHTAAGEAFGNVLAEAMACEAPVVAIRSGSLPEVVEDGVTGLLAAPGPREAEDLAAALATLHADPAMRRRFGEAGRKRSIALFSVERSVERTLAAYGKAVST